MTFREFQYWLEGLEEGLGGEPPNATQWALIKEKMGSVSETQPIVFNGPIYNPVPYPSPPWRIWTTPVRPSTGDDIQTYTTGKIEAQASSN